MDSEIKAALQETIDIWSLRAKGETVSGQCPMCLLHIKRFGESASCTGCFTETICRSDERVFWSIAKDSEEAKGLAYEVLDQLVELLSTATIEEGESS